MPILNKAFLLIIAFVLGLSLRSSEGSPRTFSELSSRSLLHGQPLKLDWKGRTSILIFLSTICPCSRSHEKKIADLIRDFPDYRFYAVHSNREEGLEDLKKYWASRQVLFVDILDDREQRLANAFGALKTPHAFVIDSAGREIYRGAIDNSHMADRATKDYLRTVLSDLRESRPITLTESRPLGCTISR